MVFATFFRSYACLFVYVVRLFYFVYDFDVAAGRRRCGRVLGRGGKGGGGGGVPYFFHSVNAADLSVTSRVAICNIGE